MSIEIALINNIPEKTINRFFNEINEECGKMMIISSMTMKMAHNTRYGLWIVSNKEQDDKIKNIIKKYKEEVLEYFIHTVIIN